MDKLTLTVTEAQAGRTVESLMRRELSMSGSLISSVKFRPMGICLNGLSVHTTARVSAGDVLTVSVADRGKNSAEALEIPLRILWEDEALAIIDKPAGISVYGEGRPNLRGILAHKWGTSSEFHPVNRLDVGTSGLMLAAKDGYTHDRLRRLLHTEDFVREYLAVAEGAVPSQPGCVELPISAAPVEGTRRAIDPDGLPSRTDYTVIRQGEKRTLLRLRLQTGRTHQIRVHMSALGHPLVGDRMYGASDMAIDRPALHSCRIRLVHPLTGQLVDISSPLPPDIAGLIPPEEPPRVYGQHKNTPCEEQLGKC